MKVLIISIWGLELDCFSVDIHLKELDKLEDKVEGRYTDCEESDTDARQHIVGLWAWQPHGIVEVGLPWSHRPLALIEGEH
ncbi:hypothetical protein BHE74_00012260 [Ensete ventricosum]|nr:hypothetical protein BHE74_00012260 [Ensete ventricosum]